MEVGSSVGCDIESSLLARCVDFCGLRWYNCRTRSTSPGDVEGRPVDFFLHKQEVSLNCVYHAWIVLSVGGSFPYSLRKKRWTEIIDCLE